VSKVAIFLLPIRLVYVLVHSTFFFKPNSEIERHKINIFFINAKFYRHPVK
jgi:hypothetical protein